MKKYLFLTFCLLMAVGKGSALVVTAGNTVVIDHVVYEDVYISGGTVRIEAPVHGSLIVAGGTVTVKDTIFNDILVVGGNLAFYGYVGGTLRCAGGRLKVASNVSHDLAAAGGTLMLGKRDTVGGDLLATGGDLVIDGVVNGNTRVRAGSFVLNGVAVGSLECRARNIEIRGRVDGMSELAATGEIVIDDMAHMDREIRYWSPDRRVTTGRTTRKEQLVFDPALEIKGSRWYYSGSETLSGLLLYLGMALVMIFVLQYLFSSVFRKAGETVFSRPGMSFGFGIVYVVGVPAVAIVCFLSLVGIPLGLILLLGYIGTLLFSGVITALVSAYWLNGRMGTNWRPVHLGFVALGLLILIRLISAIPLLGIFLFCIMVSMAFGALLQNIRWRKKQNPAS
ncbi:MAG TPA: hypothetical protein VL727_17505 [Puia sp.]|nr:hypothetical protein [Puia sp.]